MNDTASPQHPIPFQVSDGRRLLVDWRDIEEVMRRDPDGRTLPGDDASALLLTADDYVWLRGTRIRS